MGTPIEVSESAIQPPVQSVEHHSIHANCILNVSVQDGNDPLWSLTWVFECIQWYHGSHYLIIHKSARSSASSRFSLTSYLFFLLSGSLSMHTCAL